MVRACRDGHDLHRPTASQVLGKTVEIPWI